jgi:hypothetical protein
MFVECNVCESLKDLISKLGKNNNEALKYEVKLRKYILNQELCKKLIPYLEDRVSAIKG